jgi:hypothetical protein
LTFFASNPFYSSGKKQVSEERSKFIPRAQENVFFSDESHSRRRGKEAFVAI